MSRIGNRITGGTQSPGPTAQELGAEFADSVTSSKAYLELIDIDVLWTALSGGA